MSWEKPCELCRTYTAVEFLARVEVWPIALVCSGCETELLADDEDPRSGEPDACDACGGGGCRLCLAVPGWLG